MKRHWITSMIATMAVAFALSAHAQDKQPSAGDVVDLGLIVGGIPIDDLTTEQANSIFLSLFGEEFESEFRRDALRDALEALDQGKSDRPDIAALRGLSGISAAQLANRVLFPSVKREKKGLIGDYLVFFNQTGHKATGHGHLTFDIKTEIFSTPHKTIRRQWHIDVLNGGFNVHHRNETNAPNNDPFPGTVEFPDYSVDHTDKRSVWHRGLNHKLFAVGTEIVVRDIFIQIDNGPVSRVPDSDKQYQSTAVSCIDLMTKGEPPAFRFDPIFQKQSAYCLGWCFLASGGLPIRSIINSM